MVGMKGLLALERKNLGDLIVTLMHSRQRFIRECDRLAEFPYRAILIEASYEEINSPYHEYTETHPNGISGSLDAIETKYSIPIILTSSIRELTERKAASSPGSQRRLLIGCWRIMGTAGYFKKEIYDRFIKRAQIGAALNTCTGRPGNSPVQAQVYRDTTKICAPGVCCINHTGDPDLKRADSYIVNDIGELMTLNHPETLSFPKIQTQSRKGTGWPD